MTSLAILATFWLWGRVDRKLTEYYLKKYKPAPQVSPPRFVSSDVSIVVCINALDAQLESFTTSLRSWLRNKPREIIIMVANREQVEQITAAVEEEVPPSTITASKIHVLEAELPRRRAQLAQGASRATGAIVASCSEDVVWPEAYLMNMLPCFEDPRVGGAGQPIIPYIPEERRDDSVITPSEAAAVRIAYTRDAAVKATYAATRCCPALDGDAALYRANVLKDPCFLEAYMSESQHGSGHSLEAGEDSFISRWLQQNEWTIAVQAKPETNVSRTVRASGGLFPETLCEGRRASCSGLRTILSISPILKSGPVAGTMAEGMFRSILMILQILAWILSLHSYPELTALLFFHHIWASASDYAQFLSEYPYMWRQFWVIVLVDYLYVIQDICGWVTPSNCD